MLSKREYESGEGASIQNILMGWLGFPIGFQEGCDGSELTSPSSNATLKVR
jgi:hypothetical protein